MNYDVDLNWIEVSVRKYQLSIQACEGFTNDKPAVLSGVTLNQHPMLQLPEKHS